MRARQLARIAFLGLLIACNSAWGCAPHSRPRTRTGAARLWIGGDVHLADERWLPELGLSEPGFVNLEGAVGIEAPWSVIDEKTHRVQLTHSEDAVRSLAPGVRFVGTANNHTHDTEDGVPRSLLEDAGLTEVNGLVRIKSGGQGLQMVTVHLDASDPDTLDAAAEVLAHVSTNPPLLVAFHLTEERPSYLPGSTLLEATEMALDAGADLVVSHGTHLIGPIKRREGAVVAYGLGNLMFNCTCTRETDAIVLRWLGDGTVEVVPVVAGLDGEPPRRATGEEARGIFDLLKAVGSDDFVWVEDRAVVPPSRGGQ